MEPGTHTPPLLLLELLATELLATELPAIELLAIELLATEVLATEVLATEVLAMEVLATDVLATELLATEVLATEVLAMELLLLELLALNAPPTPSPPEPGRSVDCAPHDSAAMGTRSERRAAARRAGRMDPPGRADRNARRLARACWLVKDAVGGPLCARLSSEPRRPMQDGAPSSSASSTP